MNVNQPTGDSLNDRVFQALLVECLEKLERGDALDADQLLAANPEHADALSAFLADQQMLRRVAGEMRDSLSGHSSSRQRENQLEETIDSNPKAVTLAAGERIRYIGEYEILDEIARGGMGVVFKAKQQKLGRVVALKMILSGQFADDTDVDRFHREARAAGRLKHRNIVPIHEIGEHEGHHYFTMDFVDGHSLSNEIRDESLSPRRAAELIRKVAEAVEFAHQQGTLHRDIKPANILLDSDNEPHVTDFGLAKVLGDDEELTASGQILGTPSYMSPEQAAGKHSHVGPASDIYALGAVLYACLTGRAPFVADSPVDTLMQVIRKEPVSPRQLNPAIPRDRETICLKCLRKEPHKRYGTARDLAEDLDRFLKGRPVTARPVGHIERSWRWTKRNPVVAGLLFLFTATFLTGFGISCYFAYVASQRAIAEAEQRRIAEDSTAEALEERERAEKQVYALKIRQAHREWESNSARSAWASLDDCRWDLRGWEHDFLHTKLTAGTTLRGHLDRVRFVGFTHNGTELLSVSNDRTVIRWNTSTGNLLAKYVTTMPQLTSAAIHRDGGRIVLIDHRGLKVVNYLTGEVTASENVGNLGVQSMAVHPGGEMVAMGLVWKNPMVQLRNVDTGELLVSLDSGGSDVHAVCFNPEGNQIVAGLENGEVKIWVAEDEPMSFDEVAVLQAGGGAIRAVAFNRSGQRMATAGDDSLVRIWDIESRQIVATMSGHEGPVHSVTFSEDGTLVATGGRDTTVRVWDAMTGAQGSIHRGHTAPVLSVAFDPAGERVASSGEDAAVKLWTLQPQHELTTNSNQIRCMALSQDGSKLAVSSGESAIDIWNVHERKKVLSIAGNGQLLRDLVFCNNDQMLASCGGRPGQEGLIHLWNMADGKLVKTFRGHSVPVEQLAVCRDGTRIVSGGGEHLRRPGNDDVLPGEAIVWDTQSGKELFRSNDFDASVSAVDISPDGRRIATGSRDVGVWNVETGERIFTAAHRIRLQGESVSSAVAFSHDGRRIVAGSYNGDVQVWDIDENREVLCQEGHRGPVMSVAFGPQGERCFSGSVDRTVRVWEPQTGTELLSIEAYPEMINCLALSRDGTRLFVGGDDSTVRILDAGRPQQNYPLRTHADGAAFTSDHTRLVTYGDDTHVTVWDLATGKLMRELPPESGRVSSAVFDAAGDYLAYSFGPWRGANQIALVNLNVNEERTDFATTAVPILDIDICQDSRHLACACNDGSVYVWDIASKKRRHFKPSNESAANCVSFAASGHAMVVGYDDGTTRWWDLDSPQPRLTLPSASGNVSSVCVSPDESFIASGMENGTVLIWETKSGDLVATLTGHERRVNSLAFVMESSQVFTASDDQTIRIWDIRNGNQLKRLEGHHGRVLAIAATDSGNTLQSVAVDSRMELQFAIILDFTTRSEYRRWKLATE